MKVFHALLLTLSFIFAFVLASAGSQPSIRSGGTTITPSKEVGDAYQEPNINTLYNMMFRETVGNSGNITVDPFSGRFKLLVHLVDVPLNDGLDLQFSLNNSATPFLYYIDMLHGIYAGPFGYLVRGTPGIAVASPIYPSADNQPFLFTDPAGHVHHFYLHVGHKSQANTYLSTDGWIAQLYTSPVQIQISARGAAYGNYYTGYIRSPNGTTYNISPLVGLFSAVNSITSPHGGASIHYHYNPVGQLTQIQASNGYTVNLSYSLAKDNITVTDSNNRAWVIQDTTDHRYPYRDAVLPRVTSIVLPNGHSWQFLWTSQEDQYHLDTGWYKVITPLGLTLLATRTLDDNDRLSFPISAIIYSGKGIRNSTWHYQYQQGYPAKTIVTNDSQRIVYNFDNIYQHYKPLWHTGLLLSKQIYNRSGSALFENIAYQWGSREISADQGGGAPELQKKIITRGTSTYTTEYDYYDYYGYPHRIVNASSQGQISEGVTYYQNPTLWIFKPQNATTYDADGKTVVNTVSRQFDDKGELTQKTVNDVTTKYTYDSGGNLASVTDALGHKTTYRNYLCGVAQTVTDPLGNSQHYQMNHNGTLATYTDPLGNVTRYTYDVMLRPTSITYPEGNQIKYQWDQAAQNSETLIKENDYKQVIINNAVNKPLTISTTANGHTVNQAFYYDQLDRQIFHTNYNSVYGIQTAYDPLNRPIFIKQGVKLNQVGGPSYNYTYNDSAKTLAIQNPKGAVTTYQYRAFGNPDQSQLIGITQANGTHTTISRNAIGQITAIEQGTQRYGYHYGRHHYLIQQTEPEIGTIDYSRNVIGQVTTKTINVTHKIHYAYNANGHLTDERFSDNTPPIWYRYNANGDLIAAINHNAQWYYGYNHDGQLKTAKVVLPQSGQTQTFSYHYNKYAQLNGLTYPDGLNITYQTNGFNQPTELASPTEAFLFHIQFGSNQKLASFQSPTGNVTRFTYNNRNLLDTITVSHGDSPLLSRHYSYDPASNITRISHAQNSADNQSMQYNAINELTQAIGSWGKAAYQYDANNNIIQRTLNGQIYHYHYNNQNRLATLTGAVDDTFTYDLDGNITQLGQLKLTYNLLNQLTTIVGKNSQGQTVSLQYRYDANGNRIATTRDNKKRSTVTLYNRHQQLLFRQDGQHSDDYLYLDGKLVVKAQDAGKGDLTWFHNNALGSPIAASTQSATGLYWQQQYQPYGTELKNLSQQRPMMHTGFTGKQQDSSTGISYYGARDYSPFLTRFLSPDPAAINPKDPFSVNRYLYANANPYGFIDPTGAFSWETSQSIFKAAFNDFIGGLDFGLTGGIFQSDYQSATIFSLGSIIGAIGGSLAGTTEEGMAASAAASVERYTSGLFGRGVAGTEGAVRNTGSTPAKLYHYTSSEYASSIVENGLRPGASGKVFTTPDGSMSGSQAQIDLALPPNRGLPDALLEVDTKTLQSADIEIPTPSQVGRDFNMPGGGQEVVFDSLIPPEAIRRVW